MGMTSMTPTTGDDDKAALRAAQVQRLQALPAAMRERPQWLLWRLEAVPGRDGLQKVPYYVSGSMRRGELGGEADLQALATFDQAVHRFERSPSFTGVGFAFLVGDGLIGIDLDWKDTGEPARHHEEIIEACPSYTETTPSGKGVHIIVQGQCDSFKHDSVGVEVYCGGRYFTCTGERWEAAPHEVQPIKPYALAYLRELVQTAKDKARAEKAAAQAPRPERAAAPHVPAAGGNDFERVNTAALASLGAWVPQALPGARVWQSGYRVTSKALGRDLQEDLQLTPDGVMDFGEEQGMSPVDVVLKWVPGMAAPKDALHWLAQRLGITLARPRHLRVAHPAGPSPADAAAADDVELNVLPTGLPVGEPDIGPDPPPPPLLEEGSGAPPKPPRGRRGRGAANSPRDEGGAGGGALEALLRDFALVYGTDQVWDGTKRMTMAVKNLRLLFGAPYVSSWLAHPERKLLLPDQIKFEPGVDLPPPCVNLFDGFPVEPEPCTEADVEPILDLLHHLTSLCCVRGPTGELLPAGQQVFDQVLRWCALMVQKPGAKSRFAMVFHGPQGTGKNLFWDTFRRLLGKYGKMVGQTELEDRFNGYMSGKLLLIGNEVVTRQELWHNKNKLKWVITEDEIPIRGMHQEVRWESNHANIVFLSNELQPVALERDDRRHLVVYTPAADDPALYARVVKWQAEGGYAKLMHYLLQVDLGDFTEHTRPMMTVAKEALIELGLKPAERFAVEWLDGFLDLPVRVCSNTQAFGLFERWCRMNGERGFSNQATFTKTMERFIFERVERDGDGNRLPPALAYKQINLKHESGHRKTVRCWVPRGAEPPAGVTEGEWACASIDAFERDVSRFGRTGEPEGGAA